MEDVITAAVEMPRYVCHKTVHALKLGGVGPKERDGSAFLYPSEKTYAPFRVSADYMTKHNPHVGGYYVVYKDGYVSFSPADAFEGGYTRI